MLPMPWSRSCAPITHAPWAASLPYRTVLSSDSAKYLPGGAEAMKAVAASLPKLPRATFTALLHFGPALDAVVERLAWDEQFLRASMVRKFPWGLCLPARGVVG